MAYIHFYHIAISTMIRYMFHLHKTHVSYNKRQEQYGKKSKKKELNYAMLYYIHLKLKKLMLVLTSNVSGYTIFIELYGAHVIYVIVWFWING